MGSSAHGVLGGLAVLEVLGGVLVEDVDAAAPGELLDHVAPQVDVVVGAREVAVGFHQGVGAGLCDLVHVGPLHRVVVLHGRDGAQVGQEAHVLHVVVGPDGGVEGHLAVLRHRKSTISSMALESRLKTSVSTLSRS